MVSVKSLQEQEHKLQDFETNRALLESAITALDKKLSNFAITFPPPEDVKAAVELQQQLKARMASMRPPIVVSGFYFSSTMLLWPVIFTCLGWVAFLVPPRFRFAPFQTHFKRILVFTLGITVFYRWPTWARNFIFNKEGRIFFGVANLDVDPAGFFVQEGLGLTVSFLLAVIWTKWMVLFGERAREPSIPISDPISAALAWSALAQLSRTFIHWQVSSVILACGFIPYLYFFWDAVLRGHDQRYLIAAITVQALWATTWIIVTLPLANTLYAWQSIRAAAVCAAGKKALQKEEGMDSVLDAIKALEPINPWNLAVTSVAFFVSFVAPIVQHLHS